VGTGKPGSTIGQWQEAEYAGRPIQFMPAIALEDDNVRTLVPTTLKYTAALVGKDFSSDFMHFYRIEPTVLTRNWSGHKSLFVQTDIQKQLDIAQGNNAILWQRFPWLYFKLEGYLIEQFEQVYCCHSESVDFYQKRYPSIAERFSFLKNTVDDDLFYPLDSNARSGARIDLARRMNLPDETRFVLFAGRLHPQKDPLLLIRSFIALDRPHTHLLMAGFGELENAIRDEIARSDLSAKVTLLGSMAQRELAHLHRLSSVFILTSAYEGLPFVVLEALACGTPVVTTDSGETPHLLSRQSGIVCRARTPEAIASALRQVLQNPDDFPVEACVRAAQPFGARTVVGTVYQDMLERWQQTALSNLSLGL
jgi:glycosyltransferase involved in cell wall biosynthesis